MTETNESNVLVGRWFLSTAALGWKGQVIGEPQPGTYLVQLWEPVIRTRWDKTVQVLVPFTDMAGWGFYAKADEMFHKYLHGGVKRRWEQEAAALAATTEDGA